MDTERHSSHRPAIAILSRGDAAARRDATAQNSRFVRVCEALAALGIDARPVIYDEGFTDAVRDQLLAADGVLVWVDPIHQGKTRGPRHPASRRQKARAAGECTSRRDPDDGRQGGALPDASSRLGRRPAPPRHRPELPRRVSAAASGERSARAEAESRQWRPGRLEVEALPGTQDIVRVLHAQRGSMPEDMPLDALFARCEPYFGWGGCIIDQAFQPRLPT
jgi:hypothetical protein